MAQPFARNSADEGLRKSPDHGQRPPLTSSAVSDEMYSRDRREPRDRRFISDSFAAIDKLLLHYAARHEAALAADVLGTKAQIVTDTIEGAELGFLREELPGAIVQSLSGIQQVARIASAMKTPPFTSLPATRPLRGRRRSDFVV